MAEWTLTLSVEHETALAALTEQWLREQPETAWTPQLVLSRIVDSTLQSTLRGLDTDLAPLLAIARRVSRAEYLPFIRELDGAQRTRLRQVLGETGP